MRQPRLTVDAALHEMTSKHENAEPGKGPAENPGATQGGDGEVATRLARVLDQCLQELEAGRPVDRARLLADNPGLGPQLEAALAGLEFIHGTAAGSAGIPARMGDFRIVREVGRGGMGVVYEAEQESLRRRVALKVLRWGGVADEVAMQRFQREAETIGRLHHTNIVPIFAIGAEQGVPYYAMQFIEGRDLAEVLRGGVPGEASGRWQAIAGWMLQASEALAHAHDRGVIHRDIKPSNLILDPDGRIWLTDFGLARRIDDVTLSLTGALLGTPRYMSPEQAASASRPVDHRTDIYSLGATLYELATGRPIFEAPSPHEVITKILNADPLRPRQLQPMMPRDLETIILTCLAKEPGSRYATAQALANDLRAFLEGRALLARRPSVAERASRWARQNRHQLVVGVGSAVAAVLVAAAGVWGWQAHRRAGTGEWVLSSADPSAQAELLDAEGNPLGGFLAMPMTDPLRTAAGEYQVRVSAPGVLSETWPMTLGRGERRHVQLGMTPRWLGPSLESPPGESWETTVRSIGPRADLVVMVHPAGRDSGRPSPSLRLLDAVTGRPKWSGDLSFDPAAAPMGADSQAWRDQFQWSDGAMRPVVAEAVGCGGDLDGDGVAEVVVGGRNGLTAVAASGATGRVLWWHNEGKVNWESPRVTGLAMIPDVDGDGVDDLLLRGSPVAGRMSQQVQQWLSLVSGRTGTSVWRRAGGLVLPRDHGGVPSRAIWSGKLVVVAMGPRTEGASVVDVATGRDLGIAIPAGVEAIEAPRWVDVDGDGAPELLVMVATELEGENINVATRRAWSLAAFRPGVGQELWRVGLGEGPAATSRDEASRLARWRELPGPEGGVVAGFVQVRDGWTEAGVQSVDLAGGRVRWREVLSRFSGWGSGSESPALGVGSDLDGDGWAEVLVATTAHDRTSDRHGLRVSARSGKDGSVVWSRHVPGVGTPLETGWWVHGTEGSPLWAVRCGKVSAGRETTVFLASGSGRVEHVLYDAERTEFQDFDGDGLTDLLVGVGRPVGGRERVVQGRPPEVWRRLGDWEVVGDLDGDGVEDLVEHTWQHLAARSGKSGVELWNRSTLPDRVTGWVTRGRSVADWNGDGVADLVVRLEAQREQKPGLATHLSTVAVYSGRDGRRLWAGMDADLGSGSTSGFQTAWDYVYPCAETIDLDGDGVSEVIGASQGTGGGVRLTVFHGTDGRIRWSTEIVPGGWAPDPRPAGAPVADFNGDGVKDVALCLMPGMAGGLDDRPAINVLDGRDGRPLWGSGVPWVREDRLVWPEPVVGDLTGEGVPEVIVVRHGGYSGAPSGYRCELVVLDGATGLVRWTWSWNAGFPEVLPPMVLRQKGAETGLVAFGFREEGFGGFVVLDGTGREVVRRRLGWPSNRMRETSLIWGAHDLDSDGVPELVFGDGGELRVVGVGDWEARWGWPLSKEDTRVVGMWRGGGDPALVVWAGPNVFGLDGRTGRARWRGRVDGWAGFGPERAGLRLSGGEGTGGLPRLIASANISRTTVTLALPAQGDGAYAVRRP